MPSRVGQDTVDQEDDYPDESSHSLGSFGEAIGGRFSVTDRRLVASTRVHDISDEDTVYTALFTAGYYTLDRSATTESAVTEVDIRERGTYHD